jgi:hypothetical protein
MKSLLAGCAIALVSSAVLAGNNFTIVGTRIYDPSGKEFLARGINLPGFNNWAGHDSTPDASLIADAWGFNLVRVNCLPMTAPVNPGAGIDMDAMVKAFTTDRIAAGKQPLVVMIEPHESTDRYFEGAELQNVTAWFRDLGNKYRDNPYVWFNVGNEPGDKQKPADWPADQYWDPFQPDVDKWLTMHQTVIRAIRNDVNNRNIVVADGIIDGQDQPWDDGPNLNLAHSAILPYGKDLQHFDNKDWQNILFDTHIYGMWMAPGATPDRLEKYILEARKRNLPLIFGEYAPTGDSNWKLVQDMWQLADKYRIGRAGWSWSDWRDFPDLTTTPDPDPAAVGTLWATGGGYLINDLEHPTNLTEWGQGLWNDNRDIQADRYLIKGDANDDGVLNADDYAAIDRGLALHLDGWTNGDFNGDGIIDAGDYLVIDTEFGVEHGLSPEMLSERQAEFGEGYVSSLVAAVPEPGVGMLAAAAVAACKLGCRRRRTGIE